MPVLLLEVDVSGKSPFPEASLRNVVRRRGDVMMGGSPIANWLPANAYVDVSDGAESPAGLPDFIRGVGFAVASHRLMRVLDESHGEVEFVPIPLQYQGAQQPGFFLANPVRRVQAVDLSRSSIELDEVGIALSVQSLVLNESALAGIPMAFLYEVAKIAVQPEVATAILKAGLSGCSFVDPSEYRLR